MVGLLLCLFVFLIVVILCVAGAQSPVVYELALSADGRSGTWEQHFASGAQRCFEPADRSLSMNPGWFDPCGAQCWEPRRGTLPAPCSTMNSPSVRTPSFDVLQIVR